MPVIGVKENTYKRFKDFANGSMDDTVINHLLDNQQSIFTKPPELVKQETGLQDQKLITENNALKGQLLDAAKQIATLQKKIKKLSEE